MYMVPGTARPLDGRPQKEVQVGPDKLGLNVFYFNTFIST